MFLSQLIFSQVYSFNCSNYNDRYIRDSHSINIRPPFVYQDSVPYAYDPIRRYIPEFILQPFRIRSSLATRVPKYVLHSRWPALIRLGPFPDVFLAPHFVCQTVNLLSLCGTRQIRVGQVLERNVLEFDHNRSPLFLVVRRRSQYMFPKEPFLI